MRTIIILLFCFLYTSIFAQSTKKDVDILLDRAIKMGDSIQEQAIELGLQAYNISEKIAYTEGISKGLLIAARNSYDLGKYADVIKYATKAITNAEKLKNAADEAEAHQLAGLGYSELGFVDKGKTELTKGLSVAQYIDDKNTKNFRIGFIYTGLAVNLDRDSGNVDSIISNHQNALSSFERLADTVSYRNSVLSMSYSNLGLCFAKKGEMQKAESFLRKALNLSQNGSQQIEVYALLELGRLYNEQFKFVGAIEYFKKGILIADKLANPYISKDFYKGISDSYTQIDSIEKAQFYLQKYSVLSDSLSILEKDNLKIPLDQIIKEKEVKYDVLKRNSFLLIIIGVVLLAVLFFWNRKKSIKNRKKYQLVIDRLEKNKMNEIVLKDKPTKSSIQISKTKENEILNNLDNLMLKNEFIKAEMSLPYLANKLNTNTKYLSEIIKGNKNKNFNSYINGLRIDYIVKKLYDEKIYREYKIETLAQESGFSSREVFTTVFKKETGIAPYSFIKAIIKS